MAWSGWSVSQVKEGWEREEEHLQKEQQVKDPEIGDSMALSRNSERARVTGAERG